MVAGAAAKIAGQGLGCLADVRVGPFFEQFGSTHQKAGRTIAALYTAALDQRLLERVQLRSCAQPFDRHDRAAPGPFGRHHACHHGHPIK
jgi:hypothetical protein